MSRADRERIDDILDAASEIASVVDAGRQAWDSNRALLAHHYHRVDPDQVWTIATRDVPALVEHLHRR